MNINEIAKYYLDQFEYVKRGDKTITVMKDSRDKELYDAVFKAHEDKLPLDFIFDKFSSILDAIGEYTNNDIDDLRDNGLEIVDGLVSVYTSDLTAWLNENNYNVYYLTEALEDGDCDDGFKLLMRAQYKAIDDIFAGVVELIENKLDQQ